MTDFHYSSSGKTIIIASTEGNVAVDGHEEVKVGLILGHKRSGLAQLDRVPDFSACLCVAARRQVAFVPDEGHYLSFPSAPGRSVPLLFPLRSGVVNSNFPNTFFTESRNRLSAGGVKQGKIDFRPFFAQSASVVIFSPRR